MSPLAVAEHALAFDCQGQTLVGVLSAPAIKDGAPGLGVVIVVGGPQVRTGSHRQFTLLSRRLASAGTPCLRFDVRGMGDSTGEQRSFEDLDDDIASAVDTLLSRQPSLGGVVLWGLCDGASAALLYVHRRRDPRVAALALANPWVRSDASLARARVKHYYLQRLMQPQFWRKLLSGGVGRRAILSVRSNLRLARSEVGRPGADSDAAGDFRRRMARGWRDFDGPILLLLSDNDMTAREFSDHAGRDPAWTDAMRRRPPTRVSLADADHTFSAPACRVEAEDATLRWLLGLATPDKAA